MHAQTYSLEQTTAVVRTARLDSGKEERADYSLAVKSTVTLMVFVRKNWQGSAGQGVMSTLLMVPLTEPGTV